MRLWEPNTYYYLGRQRGIPQEVLEEALSAARRLQTDGISAVLTLGHLAKQTNVPYTYLRRVVSRWPIQPYSRAVIKKKSGGTRTLLIPDDPLMRVQRWINLNILQPSAVKVHPASVAYMRGQTIVAAASRHCGARWMVKVDIKDFFDSITETSVYYVFQSLGYRPLISFEMARLCTVGLRLRPYRTTAMLLDEMKNYPFDWIDDDMFSRPDLDSQVAIISGREESSIQLCEPVNRGGSEEMTLGIDDGAKSAAGPSPPKFPYRAAGDDAHLPQGAPTSPALSNLVMRNFDAAMSSHAAGFGFVYTRYSDDMIFSSSGTNDRARCAALAKESCALLGRFSFEPNYKKVKIFSPGARKMAYGLVVNSSRPRLTREIRFSLENQVYKVIKHGLASISTGTGTVDYSLSRLLGWLHYASQVEPEFANPLLDKVKSSIGDLPS